MQVKREELLAQYKQLADHELVRRAESGTLTPMALEALVEELRSRGIELDSLPLHAESQGGVESEDSPAEEQFDRDLITVAHFVNPLRAGLFRARLESEGIAVHVIGEHLAYAHVFLSATAGGIRVQVQSDQADRAYEVLAEFDRIEQEISEESRDARELPESAAATQFSTQKDSPYAPPKARVADIEVVEKRRVSLNKPSTPVFFWIFALIAAVAIVLVVLGG